MIQYRESKLVADSFDGEYGEVTLLSLLQDLGFCLHETSLTVASSSLL